MEYVSMVQLKHSVNEKKVLVLRCQLLVSLFMGV